MKSKSRAVIKLILLCAGAIFVCDILYYFADYVCNGAFADWFTENYMFEHTYLRGDEVVYVQEPYWFELKRLIFAALCAAALLITVLSFVISRVCVKAKERENAERMSKIQSAMQRHEQMLREETGRKNDLITYLAHDLKTPLTSVIGYLSLLEEAPEMSAQQRAKYVHIALDKAQRLEKLINEFFDITRYNLQQVELEEEIIDLSYMLAQMTDEFYPLLSTHGNTVRLRAEEALKIQGDPDKLARVFNNILKNAIAYSYPDTEIEVWTESGEGKVRIFFQNRGKTIPEKKLNVIFEKFFRLDEARTTNTGGAGLGLAIAKEIVALHRGSITARSEDELTTFCVVLPACPADKGAG